MAGSSKLWKTSDYSKVRIKGKGILDKKKNTEKNQIGKCKFHISESSLRKRTEEDKDIEVGYFPGGPWLRFCAPNAGSIASIPGQGTRSHVPQLKILHARTNTWYSQINKYKQTI